MATENTPEYRWHHSGLLQWLNYCAQIGQHFAAQSCFSYSLHIHPETECKWTRWTLHLTQYDIFNVCGSVQQRIIFHCSFLHLDFFNVSHISQVCQCMLINSWWAREANQTFLFTNMYISAEERSSHRYGYQFHGSALYSTFWANYYDLIELTEKDWILKSHKTSALKSITCGR